MKKTAFIILSLICVLSFGCITASAHHGHGGHGCGYRRTAEQQVISCYSYHDGHACYFDDCQCLCYDDDGDYVCDGCERQLSDCGREPICHQYSHDHHSCRS